MSKKHRISFKFRKPCKLLTATLLLLMPIYFTNASKAFSAEKKPDKSRKEKRKTEIIDVKPEDQTFSFLETDFVFGRRKSADAQVLTDFVPKGESVEKTQKLVTVIRDMSGKADRILLDSVADAMLADFKAKKVLISKPFTTKDGGHFAHIMTIVFPETTARVDLKKIFVDDDGFLVTNTFEVKIKGSNEKETVKATEDYVKSLKDITQKFIEYEFPQIK